MKAYEITEKKEWGEERSIVAAENVEEAKKSFTGEIDEIEELCELLPGCSGADIPYFLEGEEEISSGDFILENGAVIGDSSHSGAGMAMGDIDIARTNELSEKDGCNPFSDWEFNLWIGSFWNGSNWRVITIER